MLRLMIAIGCLVAGTSTTLAFAVTQEEPVLMAGEREISAAEFEPWLVALQGEAYANGFVRAWLIHREAVRQDLVPSHEELVERIEAQIAERVEHAFQGDRAAWLQELEASGTDRFAYMSTQERVAAQALELENLIRASRTFPESALRAEWERLFGKDGRTLQLRMIALDVPYGERSPGTTRQEVNEKRKRVEAETLTRAAALRARILAGEKFEELAKTVSEDEPTRAAGGLLPAGFDTRGFSKEKVAEVYSLKQNDICQPMIVRGRALLLQLASETVTPFEAARATALENLVSEPVSTAETDGYVDDLEARAPSVILPAMAALEPPSGSRSYAVLTIGETEISFDEYATWLRQRIGQSMASQFVRDLLIDELARERKVELSEETIAKRVEEMRQFKVATQFHGKQAAWEASLAMRGHTREMFERQASIRARIDLLAEKLMLLDREFTEQELRDAWLQRYGKNGRAQHVRLMMKIVIPPDLPRDATAEVAARLRREASEKARLELVALRDRIIDGEDFAALARLYSDDELTREAGGTLDVPFAERRWPEEFHEAVEALEVGRLTEPLFNTGAWFLFELLSDVSIPFEDVREELRTELKQERPPAIQVAVFMNSLLAKTKLRVLPAMYH